MKSAFEATTIASDMHKEHFWKWIKSEHAEDDSALCQFPPSAHYSMEIKSRSKVRKLPSVCCHYSCRWLRRLHFRRGELWKRKRQWTVTCPAPYILSTHLFSLAPSRDTAMLFLLVSRNFKQENWQRGNRNSKKNDRKQKKYDTATIVLVLPHFTSQRLILIAQLIVNYNSEYLFLKCVIYIFFILYSVFIHEWSIFLSIYFYCCFFIAFLLLYAFLSLFIYTILAINELITMT